MLKIEKIVDVTRFKYCACGCGQLFFMYDKRGRSRRFINNHRPKGESSPNYGRTDTRGENNPAWKGGKTKTCDGYVYVYAPDHPFRTKQNKVRQHRLEMEKKEGRYITKEESIHHIIPVSRGGTDDIDNLMLFPNEADHRKFERTINKSGRFCEICKSDKTFVNKKGHEYWYYYYNDKTKFICSYCKDKQRYYNDKKIHG